MIIQPVFSSSNTISIQRVPASFGEGLTGYIRPSFADTNDIIQNFKQSFAVKQDAINSLFMDDLYVSERPFTITNVDAHLYEKMYRQMQEDIKLNILGNGHNK